MDLQSSGYYSAGKQTVGFSVKSKRNIFGFKLYIVRSVREQLFTHGPRWICLVELPRAHKRFLDKHMRSRTNSFFRSKWHSITFSWDCSLLKSQNRRSCGFLHFHHSNWDCDPVQLRLCLVLNFLLSPRPLSCSWTLSVKPGLIHSSCYCPSFLNSYVFEPLVPGSGLTGVVNVRMSPLNVSILSSGVCRPCCLSSRTESSWRCACPSSS